MHKYKKIPKLWSHVIINSMKIRGSYSQGTKQISQNYHAIKLPYMYFKIFRRFTASNMGLGVEPFQSLI